MDIIKLRFASPFLVNPLLKPFHNEREQVIPYAQNIFFDVSTIYTLIIALVCFWLVQEEICIHAHLKKNEH